MLIAVVIPAYNAASYIRATLATVAAQTYGEVEVILVDDGSSDDTAAIARQQLQESRYPWKVLSQPNAGVSAARNLGWESTSAPWVQFLDADDFLAPTKLEQQAAACANADLGTAYISSPWEEVAVEGDVRRPVRFASCATFTTQPSEIEILAKGPLLHLGQNLFRRAWVEEVAGFDRSLKVDEDQDFYLKLARKGARQIVTIGDEPLFFWRQQQRRRLGLEGARYNAIDLAGQYMQNLLRIIGGDRSVIDRLSDEDRGMLLRRCSSYLRLLYRYDIDLFRSRLRDIEAMLGRFLPEQPSYLRAIAKLVGFERAEDIASVYRRGKILLGRHVD